MDCLLYIRGSGWQTTRLKELRSRGLCFFCYFFGSRWLHAMDSSIDGRNPGVSWLHGRAPPGCPQSVRSLEALRCLLPLPRRWPFTFRQDTPGPLPHIEHVKQTAKGRAMPLNPFRLNLLRWRAGVASRNVKGARRGSGARQRSALRLATD